MDILKLFLEQFPYPIWISDIESKILFLNDAYKNLYNTNLSNVLGKDTKDVFPSELTEIYTNKQKKCLRENIPIFFDENINGVFFKSFIVPISNNNGNICAIAGVILSSKDNTDDELELKRQKNILKTIIDSLPEAIFYKDKDCKFIGYNKNFSDFYETLGITNLIGKSDLDIYPDKNVAQKFIDQDNLIIKSKKSKSSQYSIKKQDGSIRYEENLKVPVINDEGEVWGIVGLSRDITERKVLEDKLRHLSCTDSLTGLYNRYGFEEKLELFNNEDYLPLGIIMGDVNGLKLVNDTLGHLEGDKLLQVIAKILKTVCRNKGSAFRWGGDEFMILLPNCNEQICEEIMCEILENCQKYNYDFIQLSIALGEAVKTSIDEDIYNCIKEVEEKVYRRKLLDKKSIRSSITDSLRKSLQEKNTETEEHTERVTNYAYSLGNELNFKASELDELFLVAKLHDIGKIGISEEILLKPSKLTFEEFEIMKTHSEKGYRILQAVGELENVARCVLCHHEKWDGSGYPLGLKSEEIPLISRIISIVDAYDVMTSRRPYKEPLSKEDAIKELKNCAGSQFDPYLVNIFINSILKYN